MRRIGIHINFHAKLLIFLACFVIGNIMPSQERSLFLMIVLTVFALVQGQIKNTIMFWVMFLFGVVMLQLYQIYSWSDQVFSRYFFVVLRRICPTFFCLFIIGSTPASEITAGLDRLHFPKKTGIAIVTLFRYFPSLGHDIKSTYQNIKMRGLGGVKNIVLHPLRTVKCMIFPLIVYVYSTAEELAISATARGAESKNKRYSLYERKIGALDTIVSSVIFVSVFGALLF